MMGKLIAWLFLSNESGKTGKREVAIVFALVTLGLTIWAMAMGKVDGEQVTSVVTWLILATVILLAGAFGMESIIKQAGLTMGAGSPPALPQSPAQGLDQVEPGGEFSETGPPEPPASERQ